ncbi:MAG TPA: shikimate kinase [Elusimicrobiota bacterium]|jgi:shikimate kinase|nr:shikimate kinase [Elusimicrobiota bacterium]
MKSTVYLTGFMGTGKSVVGKALAKRLGRTFVDLDAVIERKAGCSVAELFSKRGEKEFRRLERAALKKTAKKEKIVVALGGGALLDKNNWALVEKNGILVKLSCSRRELVRRLRASRLSRPLLSGGSLDDRVRNLLRERRGAHGKASIAVSTTGRSADSAARFIARRML